MQKAGDWLRGMRRGEWLLVLAVLALCILVLSQGEGQEDTGGGTELEARLERVLSAIEGAGEVRVMIAQRETQEVSAFAVSQPQQEVTGVLVVCEGARDVRVRLAIEQAAQTLLGIERSRIEVAAMEGGGE